MRAGKWRGEVQVWINAGLERAIGIIARLSAGVYGCGRLRGARVIEFSEFFFYFKL